MSKFQTVCASGCEPNLCNAPMVLSIAMQEKHHLIALGFGSILKQETQIRHKNPEPWPLTSQFKTYKPRDNKSCFTCTFYCCCFFKKFIIHFYR